MGTEDEKSRPRALRDGTKEPRFAARYATIDEVAELLGVTPVSLRQTMRRRDAGEASAASDAFIDPIGNVSGYLWDRDDLTPEAIAAWHDRPRRGRKPKNAQ